MSYSEQSKPSSSNFGSLDRRSFLRGASWALALPFLESLSISGSLSAARGAIAETFVSTPEPEASWQDGEPVTPVHVVDGVVDQSVGSGQGGPSGVMTGVVVHTEHAAAYTLGGVQGVTEPGADAESGAVVTAVAITASPIAPKPRPDDDDDVDVI